MELLKKLLHKSKNTEFSNVIREARMVFNFSEVASNSASETPSEFQLNYINVKKAVDLLGKKSASAEYSSKLYDRESDFEEDENDSDFEEDENDSDFEEDETNDAKDALITAITNFLNEKYNVSTIASNVAEVIAKKLYETLYSEMQKNSSDQNLKQALTIVNDFTIINSKRGLAITIKDYETGNTLVGRTFGHTEIQNMFPNPAKTIAQLTSTSENRQLKKTLLRSETVDRQEVALLNGMTDIIQNSRTYPEEYYAPDAMMDKMDSIRSYYSRGMVNNQLLLDQSFNRAGINANQFFAELDDYNWFGARREGVTPQDILELSSYFNEFKKNGIETIGDAQNKVAELASNYANLQPAKKQLARKLVAVLQEIHTIGKLIQTLKVEANPNRMNPNPDYITKFKFDGIDSRLNLVTIETFEDKPEIYAAGLLYLSGGLSQALSKKYITINQLPGSEKGDQMNFNLNKIPANYTRTIYNELKDIDTEFKFNKGWGEGTYSITDAYDEFFNKKENNQIKAKLDGAKINYLKENPNTPETEKVKTLASLIANPLAPYFSEDGSYTINQAELQEGATVQDTLNEFTKAMPDKTLYETLIRNSYTSETNELSLTKLETYVNNLRVNAAARSFYFSPEQIKAAGFKNHQEVINFSEKDIDLKNILRQPNNQLDAKTVKLIRLGVMSDLVKPKEAASKKAEALSRLDRAQQVQFGVLSYLAANNFDSIAQAGGGLGTEIPFLARLDDQGNVISLKLNAVAGATTEGATVGGFLTLAKEYADGDAANVTVGASLKEGIIASISYQDSNEEQTAHVTYSAGVYTIQGIPFGVAKTIGYGQTRFEQAQDKMYENLQETYKLSYEDIVTLRGLAAKHKAIDQIKDHQEKEKSNQEFINALMKLSESGNKFFEQQAAFYDAQENTLKPQYGDKATFLATTLEGIVQSAADVAGAETKNNIEYEIGGGIGFPLAVVAYLKLGLPNGQTVIKTINTTPEAERDAAAQKAIDDQIQADIKKLQEQNPTAKVIDGKSGSIIRTAEGWEVIDAKDINLSKLATISRHEALHNAYGKLGLHFSEINPAEDGISHLDHNKREEFKKAGYVQLSVNTNVLDSEISFIVDPKANIDLVALRSEVNPKTGQHELYLNPGNEALAITQHTIWPDRGNEKPRVIYTISNYHTDRHALRDIDAPANIIDIRNDRLSLYDPNSTQKNVRVDRKASTKKFAEATQAEADSAFNFTEQEKAALKNYKEEINKPVNVETMTNKQKKIIDEIIALIKQYDKGSGRTKSMQIFLEATTQNKSTGYKTQIENIGGKLLDYFQQSTVITNKLKKDKLDQITTDKVGTEAVAYLIDQMTNMSMVNISKSSPENREKIVASNNRLTLLKKYMGNNSTLADNRLYETMFQGQEATLTGKAEALYKNMINNTDFDATKSTPAKDADLQDFMCGTLVGKYPQAIGHRKVLIDQNSFIKVFGKSITNVTEDELKQFYLERNDHIHDQMDLNESPLARKLLRISISQGDQQQPLLAYLAKSMNPQANVDMPKLIELCTNPENADQNKSEYKFIVNVLKKIRSGQATYTLSNGKKISITSAAFVKTGFIEPCGNFAAFTKEDISVKIEAQEFKEQGLVGGSGESTPGGQSTNVTGGNLFNINLGVATKYEKKDIPPPSTPKNAGTSNPSTTNPRGAGGPKLQ